MVGVAGYQAVTMDDIKKRFDITGLWPMDYRFFAALCPPSDSVRD